MAKTALFSRLRRLAAPLIASRTKHAAPPNGSRVARRSVLLGAAASSASLFGCDGEPQKTVDPTPTPAAGIAIVGAGLAGLHCGYWLTQAGVEVTVYEAGTRLGGRVFTGRGLLPEKLSCEFGAEFVDSNHITMLFLARELGIGLEDRQADVAVEGQVFWVSGREVSDALLSTQLEAVMPALMASLEAADRDPTALDRTPLSLWLTDNVPETRYPELFSVLTAAYRAEFGLETDQQSALNLIFMLGAPADGFLPLGASDERYRVRGGSDAFTVRLADALGDRIQKNSRLTAIRASGGAYTLRFETQTATGFEVDVGRVIFALPFSVLRTVDLGVSGLSQQKRRIIDELSYGTSAKIAGVFAPRVWRDQHGKSGSVLGDLPFQEVWDGTIEPADTHGVLVNLVGGRAGVESSASSAEQRMTELLPDLELVFPGARTAYVESSALRMDWPNAALFRGSTSCIRYGQGVDSLFAGEPEGNLYFCGEHCSLDFQGRMEGAAETGALTAARILDDLGVVRPERLDGLLSTKTTVSQPCYPVGSAPQLGLLSRRRSVIESHAVFAGEFFAQSD